MRKISVSLALIWIAIGTVGAENKAPETSPAVEVYRSSEENFISQGVEISDGTNASLKEESKIYKKVPFAEKQEFDRSPSQPSLRETPEVLKPMGPPRKRDYSHGARLPAMRPLSSDGGQDNSVADLSSALSSTKPVSKPEKTEMEKPTVTLKTEDTQFTVSPFLSWLKQTNEAEKIAEQAAKRYEIQNAEEKKQGLSIEVEFPGSSEQEGSSSAVIYSTPEK